jgi:hypothetical protein
MDRGPTWEGESYVVECAVRADGSKPAQAFLELLQSNALEDDPDAAEEPDEQVNDYAWFIRAIAHLADHGEPLYQTAVEYLRGGIWELKHGSKRITFWDTDGAGDYIPKPKIVDSRDPESAGGDYWYFPNFDEHIRLGHSFLKSGQTTTPEDLQAASNTREEDLSHDRTT